jgi:hypothetical protein
MAKTTWADIAAGDRVELGGRDWRVAKIKRKGKTVKVTVESGKRVASSKVRATDPVKRAKPEPLHEPRGMKAQRRWAEPDEAKAAGLVPGDPTVTKRPAKPSADPWETPRDGVEKRLDAILGATLVAEGDETVGYYVPPVDVTTIASHLALFHPNDYDPEKDEAAMLAGHEHAHTMAREGRKPLDVNHWHSKTRPAAA